jgi:outer membrane protein OmpA-like peptidoglycan-associated protein
MTLMRRLCGVCVLTGAALAVSTTVFAQASQASSAATSTSEEVRHATTTVSGTTGLWFVPTAEVLPAKKWSVSFYRTNKDDGQGFADVSTFPATFAVGLADRAEIFGSWALVTRIDRDTRPLFFTSTAPGAAAGTGGGILVDYPLDRQQWLGNKLGDLWLGGKLNLMGASKQPLGIAIRAQVKVPTGSKTDGASTGKADFAVDGIVSGSNGMVEVSGFGGVIARGNPSGYSLTNGFRWGVGAAFPERNNLGLRATAELFGERYFNKVITSPAGLSGSDGSAIPTSTTLKSPVFASIGLTWQAPNGFFVGAAASWNVHMSKRSAAGVGCPDGAVCTLQLISFSDTPKDTQGIQIRIGFHPGSRNRTYVAPPEPPPPPPPPPPPAPQNRPPTVRAACDPCTVEVGKTSTVSADAQDPDGDPLTYRWTAPAGAVTSPTSRQSPWTAPMQPGPVQVTVTVDDGRGGTATDTVTIQVIQPVQREFTFEDVHFDFDRYTLRADALRLLDEAVTAMQANPTLRLTIEGHTCNIGTAEYNLALGERRAQAVRDYLVSRGIDAARLSTVSYGEEQPKYDNNREETRRLNRRAALVVRLQ